ncbi:hypothetical protein LOTGIDRAFT_230066 [Lottia gigantea]|uniref:Uncharacterized protein n=1 Tax=Lottia gigantea TaxID=225164 RepID=V4CRB1_LOTGI|nr:hypothetical protein LOTGIDRAFT_230066 [Lottia gigantea]ESP05030.1 hypothetical protein LOTGIDRAFT_230066 [Lottia gigantea]
MMNLVKIAIASLLVSTFSVSCVKIQKRDTSNLPRPDISNFPRNKPNFPSNNPNFPRPGFPTNDGANNFPDMDGILDGLPDIKNIMDKFRNNPNFDSSNYQDVVNALVKDPKYQDFLKEFNPQSPNDISLEDLDKILNRISNIQNVGFQNDQRILTSDSSRTVVAMGSVVIVTVTSLFMLL